MTLTSNDDQNIPKAIKYNIVETRKHTFQSTFE